ncbi:MAG: hypothetical protein FJW69_00780 [Actinobacteria bacterium]|nr:hypothetical protein [Actinomycetota bacterium]
MVLLKKPGSISFNKNQLYVDLDLVEFNNTIKNDKNFKCSIAPENYFWLSGGGTIIFEDNFIFLVKRNSDSILNPGKFSIFTGRSNNLNEKINPELIARELFEELLIFKNNSYLYPLNNRFQVTIDNSFNEVDRIFKISKNHAIQYYNLENVNQQNKNIFIKYKGAERQFNLNYYINSKNDINIIFIFKSKTDLNELYAIDGEYFIIGNKVIKLNRDIYLFNFKNFQAIKFSKNNIQKSIKLKKGDFTEHCFYLITILRNNS